MNEVAAWQGSATEHGGGEQKSVGGGRATTKGCLSDLMSPLPITSGFMLLRLLA